MKPNDKAIEAAIRYLEAPMSAREQMEQILTAAFAAQFPPSEDYAGLVARLKQRGEWTSDKIWESEPDCHEAADAIEALLAERKNLTAAVLLSERQNEILTGDMDRLRAERDALAARLAPVEDRNLEILAAKEWIEATTDMPPRTTYTISERSLAGARAAIAAIRPHIEAAEREKLREDIKPRFSPKSAQQIRDETDQLIKKHRESVSDWLEAGSWKQSGAGNE